VGKFELDGWFVEDESKLAKLFQVRNVSFVSSSAEGRQKQLKNDLLNLYTNEGLVLIGGVQDSGKANNIQMLFHRIDTKNKDSKNYAPEVAVKAENELVKDSSETFFNEMQV